MNKLLSLTEFTKNTLSAFIELAAQTRRIVAGGKRGPQLLGSTVGGVWQRQCLQDAAFHIAATDMSADYLSLCGEQDVLRSCLALVNMGVKAVVVSCDSDDMIRSFASDCACGVISGGSAVSDPVGAAADLLALSLRLDGLFNRTVLAVGNRDVNKLDELSGCLRHFGSSLVWYLPAGDVTTQPKGVVLRDAAAAFAGVDAVIDIGLRSYCDPTKYYGAPQGIAASLMDKASVNCPLLGSAFVADSDGVRRYADNAVSLRDSCYVAAAMAAMYYVIKS